MQLEFYVMEFYDARWNFGVLRYNITKKSYSNWKPKIGSKISGNRRDANFDNFEGFPAIFPQINVKVLTTLQQLARTVRASRRC